MNDPTSNTVELDRDAELAAIERCAAEAEASEATEAEATAQAEAEAAGHDPASWLKATEFMTEVLSGQMCPAWDLQSEDKAQLSAALADVLDHYWPGGPNGIENWHPLYRLAFVAGTITVTRGFDWSTGRIRPMKNSKVADNGESETPGRESPIPGGPDAERKEHGGFALGQ